MRPCFFIKVATEIMMSKKFIKWGMIASAGLLLLDALVLEKYFFEVNKFSIGKKSKGKKLKILLLTDLHFGRWLLPYYRKLARKVNEINPDLVLIAGDLVDESGTLAPAVKFFDLLNKHIPKAGIMGNHDHKSEVWLNELQQLYANNNGLLLMNQSKAFFIRGTRLMITGLDDFIEGHANFTAAVKNVGREENHILLIHSPKQQEKVLCKIKQINGERSSNQHLNIQYIFAGHNHGGQVKIFGYAPVMPEKSGKYMNGWYNKKPPYLYVSKGFGTSTLPFRFCARSEVTVFNLHV